MGVAGRTDYNKWNKMTTDLVKEVEQEEEKEVQEEKKRLGLDGKYARSQAEAEEREKASQVKKVKKKLERFQKRESSMMEAFAGLLGPIGGSTTGEEKSPDHQTVRITRDMIDAGKRVISISDTSGASVNDIIVLTQDLSHLESKMAANALQPTKTFAEDAENDVPEEQKERSIFGVIKAFINNVHHCTIIVKCKIISGTIEMHNCSNMVLRIESEATVATIQADLSENITIEFRDAPSGKNASHIPGQKKMYWGEDKDDRIFHAGVKNLRIKLIRDDFCESELLCDYIKDGAEAIGNATAEEMQFISSVRDGELVTERAVRAGSSTGKNVRAMTERELEEAKKLREKAAQMAIDLADDMIKVQDKHGNEVKKVGKIEAEIVEEVYTPALDADVKDIVEECGQNKARGNEAFANGEYGQAILLYSLALDKATELPESAVDLVPKDVLHSNRAAAFLKLGQHEKAEQDSKKALELNPENIKANFRLGLALHAMKRWYEALPLLAKAHKLEPKNKQVKQALQFCEIRIAQDQRARTEG